MNNDPSTAITGAVPVPEAGGGTNREGNLPLPVTEGSTTSPAPNAPPPDMIKTVGGTTFEMYFHFSQTSKETFTDKVVRLIRSDV